MNKLLVIDENAGVSKVMSEILALESSDYTLYTAAARIEAEDILFKEKPPIALVCGDSDVCVAAAESLQKKSKELRFLLMSRNMDGQKSLIKKFKPLGKIELPFDPDEFVDIIDEAFFTAQDMVDELTGLYKKPAFDMKLQRLMNKKTVGTFFCISVDSYSFASNPATPLQFQMSVYAMKTKLPHVLGGIHGNTIYGFFPTSEPRETVQKKLDEVVQLMHDAVEGKEIYLAAGAAESELYDFVVEDLYLYADKGMEFSRNQGKNCIRFFK
ncbi:MAG: hypothetical protein J1F60_08570 [Oscillospiraceae bacterium]|nr:hypothetical protein [Oscillospiraceae bacterium]